MSANAILAWRNWCAEYGTMTEVVNSFELQAPLSNLLTPRTGELAIATSIGQRVFRCDWTDGRPVRMVALLNHNIVGSTDVDLTITLTDTNNVTQTVNGPAIQVVTHDFQSHLIVVFPNGAANLSRVKRVLVNIGPGVECGKKDPITGTVTAAPFRAGGLWAGPIWRPENGVRFDGWVQGITEQKRVVRSIGGQVYASPEARARRMSMEFSLLFEREVYSIEHIERAGLQQLAAWCCTSRPLIAIPTDTDPELIYLQGLYGYLDQDPSWTLADAVYDPVPETKVRSYRAALSMTEAL